MTGRHYYLTTLGDWRRHAPRFASSHWLALRDSAADSTPILVLVEGDEAAHLALENDAAFEPLPHPLAQKPVSDAVRSALAPHGLAPGATTFDVAEVLSRAHPLLRHRIF